MIFVLYEDDGPLGICGQSMSITSRWRKLIQVQDYDEAYHLLRLAHEPVKLCEKLGFCGINGSQCRENARITDVFLSKDEDFLGNDGNILDYHGKIGKYEFNNN
jgi:hypothetical protein